jgi:hypothetical protein
MNIVPPALMVAGMVQIVLGQLGSNDSFEPQHHVLEATLLPRRTTDHTVPFR